MAICFIYFITLHTFYKDNLALNHSFYQVILYDPFLFVFK